MEIKLPVIYEELNFKQKRNVRELYIKNQKWKCFYCGWSLDVAPPKRITDKIINRDLFPDNFLKYPVHLQHDHNSWLTEWAVHSYCNAVMWQYENK